MDTISACRRVISASFATSRARWSILRTFNYANEGIVQLLFFEGEPCEVSYQAREGKYQDQAQEVTLPRV